MHDYMRYVFNNATNEETDETPNALHVVPLAMGGREASDNTMYANAEDWVWAAFLALSYFDTLTVRRTGARYAKWVMKNIPTDNVKYKDRVLELCKVFLEEHANSLLPVTIYHESGKTATGNIQQLEALTGMEYNRVRDVTSGRRRYVSGWCLTKEEAAKGKQKPGRKKKVEDLGPPPRVYETPAEEMAKFFGSDN